MYLTLALWWDNIARHWGLLRKMLLLLLLLRLLGWRCGTARVCVRLCLSGTKNAQRYFLCRIFLNTHRRPGTSRQESRDIPDSLSWKPKGRQTLEGGHKLFGRHPFAWKTPTLPGGLRTQIVNLCARFSCLSLVLLPP